MEDKKMDSITMEQNKKAEIKKYSERVSKLEETPQFLGMDQLGQTHELSDETLDIIHLKKAQDYLDTLSSVALRMYKGQSTQDDDKTDAIERFRDYSIHCLDMAGRLQKNGKLGVLDETSKKIIDNFISVGQLKPILSQRESEIIMRSGFFNNGDIYEEEEFKNNVYNSICSLATISSGQLLLKTIFNLRYKFAKHQDDQKPYKKPKTVLLIENPYLIGLRAHSPGSSNNFGGA